MDSSCMCKECGKDVNQGMRNNGVEGWKEGKLCITCVFKTRPLMTNGKDGFVFALASGVYASDMPEPDASLVSCIRVACSSMYGELQDKPIGFGEKMRTKTYKEMVCKFRGVVDFFARNERQGLQQLRGYDVRALLNYTDIYDMIYIAKEAMKK